ncbi:MAG TPA: hypothetical protein VHQ86_03585 [Candidatus Saccharimonadia bacterium]|jgi:hypothetical protein|nr:hypothetical protein [Candidatus Saccharimonadia bacterium]
MSGGHQLQKALRRAASRDRKRTPRMKISGRGVFVLKKLLRKAG